MRTSELIESFIRESRSELQLAPLASGELIATAEQWEKRLSAIPVDWLARVFERVMQSHQKRTPIIPAEILAEWQKLVPAYNREQATSQEKKNCPYACSTEGWVTCNSDGSLWQGGDQDTYVRPCPLHRSQGWTAGELTMEKYHAQQRAKAQQGE